MVANFAVYGDFALQITRHILAKAKEAKESGLNPTQGDLTWDTFKRDRDSLCKAIAEKHPGGQHDKLRLVRDNFHRNVKRFTKYCKEGQGYPKKFLQDSGLLNSGFGGIEGNTAAGSDDDISFSKEEEEDVEEVPIADQDQEEAEAEPTQPAAAKKTPKKTPAKKASVPPVVELENITKKLTLDEDADDDMQILTACVEDVSVKGYGAIKFQDLLVLQALLPGGAISSTVRVEVNREDPNEGVISVEQDPNVIEGPRCISKAWRAGNLDLADSIEAVLMKGCKKFVVEGSSPDHGRFEADFIWPNGLESQLVAVDPYVLGFRVKPTPRGRTLYETKTVKCRTKEGKYVPAIIFTAFFFVEKTSIVDTGAGKGLNIDTQASDSESAGSNTPTSRKKCKSTPSSTMDTSGGVEETKS